MKITAGQLRQIIREELGRAEEVSAEDLVLLVMKAPSDEKEAQKTAVEIVTGSENDKANSFSIEGDEIYFFASADDMRRWRSMTKGDRMDTPTVLPFPKERFKHLDPRSWTGRGR
jgi:hypothetical protein